MTKTDSIQAGFIGLGAMGFSMAGNLAKAGLLAGTWNRNPVTAADFCQRHSVAAHAELSTLAESCNVLVICVSADQDVLAVLDSLLPHLQANTLVIDCSTVSRKTALVAAEKLARVHCRFLDAPVSGGTEGARLGTLSIMAGGASTDFEYARPVFEAMGKQLELMGPTGAGQATKAVNQVMAAGINQAVCEAMAFAKALDLPIDKLIDVVGSGAAGNWFVNHRGATMVKGEYPPGFKMALHLKDLLICKDMANALQGELALVEQTISDYEQLIDQGYGEEDISALYRQLRQRFPTA